MLTTDLYDATIYPDPAVTQDEPHISYASEPRRYRVRGRASGSVANCSIPDDETPWNGLGELDANERCYADTTLPSARCRRRRRETNADTAWVIVNSLREDDFFTRDHKRLGGELHTPDSIMLPYGDLMADDGLLMRFNETVDAMYKLGKLIRRYAPRHNLSKEAFRRWKQELYVLDDDTPLRKYI